MIDDFTCKMGARLPVLTGWPEFPDWLKSNRVQAGVVSPRPEYWRGVVVWCKSQESAHYDGEKETIFIKLSQYSQHFSGKNLLALNSWLAFLCCQFSVKVKTVMNTTISSTFIFAFTLGAHIWSLIKTVNSIVNSIYRNISQHATCLEIFMWDFYIDYCLFLLQHNLAVSN